MLERAVEEIVKRFPREVFPDLQLTFVESQRRLAGGSILDIRFRDQHGVHWIVELKRARITGLTVDQLTRYLRQVRADEPATRFEGMAVAFSVAAGALGHAAAQGIHCRVLKEAHLRDIAKRHGIPIDHDAGFRPKLVGTNRGRSTIREHGGSRPPTSPEAIQRVRALDAQFPPGTLAAEATPEVLEAYWRVACPSAPDAHHQTAAALSRIALTTIEGMALATRSESKSDPYTTIRAGDGRVAAAIDARLGYVKLDFPLPPNVAEDARTRGHVTVWNPRGYSVWVQSRVGKGIEFGEAQRLLRLGLIWEFRGERQ